MWIVSNWEAIQWMQQPTPQSQMDTFLPWKTCDDPIQPEDQACNIPRSAVRISVFFSLMLYINIHKKYGEGATSAFSLLAVSNSTYTMRFEASLLRVLCTSN